MKTIGLLLCTLPLVLVACSVGVTPKPTPTLTPTPILVSLGCNPPSPFREGPLGPELQGTASPPGQQFWGLIMGDLKAQVDIKIVWRMTGSGGFQLIALGPQGQQLRPKEGPTFHLSSNWNDRPGDEWGSVWRFPVPGCWDIRATRDDASGDALLIITP